MGRYAASAGPVSGDISSSGDDNPAGEATGLSPPFTNRNPHPWRDPTTC
jgi:hypothetical protein